MRTEKAPRRLLPRILGANHSTTATPTYFHQIRANQMKLKDFPGLRMEERHFINLSISPLDLVGAALTQP